MVIVASAIDDGPMINVTADVTRSIADINYLGRCVIDINVFYIVDRTGRRDILNRIRYGLRDSPGALRT
jgi:hypothetical protein